MQNWNLGCYLSLEGNTELFALATDTQPEGKEPLHTWFIPPDSREEQYNPTLHVYLHSMKPNKLSFAAARDTNDCGRRKGTQEEM